MLCAAISFSSSFLITPVFRADVLLLNAPVEERGGSLLSGLGGSAGGLAALAGLGGSRDSNTQEALAVLKSRSLIDSFVADRNLLPVIFENRWDKTTQKWKSENKSVIFPGKTPTAADAYEKFDKRIRHVEEDRRTGLITLSIEWSDPALAAQWASEIVARANGQLRSTAIERSQKSLAYLKEQASKSTELEVKQAVYKLIDSELKREMFAQVNEDYAFRIIDPPVVPEKKIRPKRSMFAVLGLLLGAITTLALVLRKESARTSI